MSRFRFTLVLLICVAPSLAWAHEIKVLANNFHCQYGDRLTLYLSWGHRLPVDDLIDGKSIDRYQLISPRAERTTLKTADLSFQANSLEVEHEGIYQALVTKKPAVLTFAYDADGNRVLKRGPKSDNKKYKIDHAFRSLQVGKALIISGKPEDEKTVQPLGLPLEIVPLNPPSNWKNGQTLRFKVLHNSKPLANETFVATYIGFQPNNAWCYSTRTNSDGVAAVRVHRGGTWVFRLRLRKPIADNPDYDFDYLTSTLTLQVR